MRPVGNSRSATRHQSRKLHLAQRDGADDQTRSPAIPELPPELMIERNEHRQDDGLLELSPRNAAWPLRSASRDKNSAHSQPARFLIICRNPISI